MFACCGANPARPSSIHTAEEAKNSKSLDKTLTNSYHADSHTTKLLLLGAGESGKSTLFKQMITLYGKGYSLTDRQGYIPIIYSNVITSIKSLSVASDTISPIQDPGVLASKTLIDSLKGDEELNEQLGEMIKQIWTDRNIQLTYASRSSFQLMDSAAYFLNKIDAICKPNYLPAESDILHSRVRTTGIVENEFTIESNIFRMYDVGGQRNERKKWIHCFESVTAVLFVAAISEYDQVLYEDEMTNRIIEALNLFEEVSNSRWFRDTSMILFLNKRDLFHEKLKTVPLSNYFNDYNGGDNYENACEYMTLLFESRCRMDGKRVYTHITCATDSENINHVFMSVKDILIRKSLNEAGLV